MKLNLNSYNPRTIDEYLAPPDVHHVKHQEYNGVGIVMVFAVILTLAHALNVYLLLWQGTPLALNVIFHVILVGVAGILVFMLKKTGTDVRLGMLMFVGSTMLGPFATAGTLLAALEGLFYIRARTDFSDWFYSIFPQGVNSRPEQIAEDLELGLDESPLDYSVIPFMDVFEIGNESQKRSALSRMASRFHPRFAPAFRKALHDDSSAIRVQAATAITKIENAFHDRLLKISKLYRENPNNPVIVKALADHYDDYAFTGLLDSEREPLNREKAREHYLQYLAMKPEDIDTRLRVGRLLVRSNRLNEASDWFRQSLDAGYANDSMKNWYIETLFKAERYDELRKAVRIHKPDMQSLKSLQPEMAESLMLWTQGVRSKNAENAA